MSDLVNEESWVWVVAQKKGSEEEIVGQHYEGEDVSFIPAFLESDAAKKSYNNMALAQDESAEIQAIRFKYLKEEASQNGFLIFLINEKGEILDKINPD